MRLDELSVELRPRAPWEAVELGTALVRRHAGAIWRPWLALTLPVFLVVNALAWAIDAVWLGALVVWWLKPVFDRIPLYVISHAVFGPAPRPRDTLRALRRWGWLPIPGYLSWRRLSPVRSLTLPVDLLEGGAHAAQRRSVVGSGVQGTAMLVTLVCANFEAVLIFGTYALALMFVPTELFSESLRAAWELLAEEPPRWLQLLGNGVVWAAMSAIEPFYVGAGFGLYLDRRTRIEAWDVEIAFRRLGKRLRNASMALLCLSLLALAVPALAQTPPAPARPATAAAPPAAKEMPVCPAPTASADLAPPPELADIFDRIESDPGFAQSVEHALHDPLLDPKQDITEWVSNSKQERGPERSNPWLAKLAELLSKVIGTAAESSLWILGAALLVVLALTRKTWLPWLQNMRVATAEQPPPVTRETQVEAEPLPADVLAQASTLWAAGAPRQALALLYRASVAAMVDRTGALLVPGATEAQCLRASRALADGEDRAAFARMVQVWQYAAYAQTLPGAEEFDSLLALLGRRFGWTA